ncbi:MAG TPA: CRTAC1 family protein, partial [Flavobacterium sp.]|nr:CRTAC1 family protein [Flavobacterium sp.]
MKKKLFSILFCASLSLANAQFTFTALEFPNTTPGSENTCVVDMNGDYLDDLVGVKNNVITISYQNPDGTFTTVVRPSTFAHHLPGWSIAAGDIDGNGFNDLMYGSADGVSFMKANDDGTAYTEMNFTQNVFSQRSNFIDINNDGDLDAFMCHDVAPNVYFINDGNGNYTFNQGGLGDFPSGGNYGSIWVDYDNDGDQDLFIAKCRGGNSGANINEMHRNNGDGTFIEVGAEAGLNDPIQSWSSAWADFDNDGDMDFYIGAYSLDNGPNKLMRNNGDGTFTNVTAGSGFDTITGNTTGISFYAHDFNNDGYVDIHGPGNRIMVNNHNMTFTSVQIVASAGLPIGDLNNDGFLDFRIYNTVYLNNPNGNNWLTLNLQGVESNRNGIGARIEIYGSWGKQIRDVRSGEGFNYMGTLNPHFGLGLADAIEKVVVKWPSG